MSALPKVSSSELIDPRGQRFVAAVTSVLLALILLAGPGSLLALVLLGVQLIAFAAGSFLGIRAQPWTVLYRRFVRPRLSPPAELEDARPPRFAQTVGLIFTFAGLIGWVLGLPPLLYLAIGFALVASLLNAVFGFCLGCELYLLVRRVSARPTVEVRV